MTGKVSSKIIVLSENIEKKWIGLRSLALQNAKLNSNIKDFISLAALNRPESEEFDEKAQIDAAEVIYEVFKDTKPTYILGVGNAGIEFSQATHRVFGQHHTKIGYGVVKNYEMRIEKKPEVGTLFHSTSYTRTGVISYLIPTLPAKSKVLIVDDVCAYGSISIAVSQELTKLGADVVGLGVYINKDWQNGLIKFTEKTGAPSFSVVRIEAIDHNANKINLVPQSNALSRFELV